MEACTLKAKPARTDANTRKHPRAAQTTILSLYVPDSPADAVPMPRHSAYTLTWLKKTLCTSKATPTTRVTMVFQGSERVATGSHTNCASAQFPQNPYATARHVRNTADWGP